MYDNYYRVDFPAISIVQIDGIIKGFESIESFNRRYPTKYAANKVRGIKIERVDHLSFTNRICAYPQAIIDESNGLDISQTGIFNILFAHAASIGIDGISLNPEYFFEQDKYLPSVIEFTSDILPILLGRADIPPGDHRIASLIDSVRRDPVARAVWLDWQSSLRGKPLIRWPLARLRQSQADISGSRSGNI